MKKKTSKASKSFNNLNSKNLIPRVGNTRDKYKKMKNYLYENEKNYESKVRNSNSIYNNKKTKKCYSLIGDSVRRLKYDKKESESTKVAGNKRRLRNLVRDKSLKLMQDYSNKNLVKKKRTSDVPPNTFQQKNKGDFNQIIEEKLRLLKTKLVHKSYEESKLVKKKKPLPELVSSIQEDAVEGVEGDYESDIPKAPFNSITMREVTPRFKQESNEKIHVLKNSSILKKRNGNVFESDYFDSTGKKSVNESSFCLGEFIRKHDPDNIFNNEDADDIGQGSLKIFKVRNIWLNKVGKIEDIAKDPVLRVSVLNYLQNKYTMIMNN